MPGMLATARPTGSQESVVRFLYPLAIAGAIVSTTTVARAQFTSAIVPLSKVQRRAPARAQVDSARQAGTAPSLARQMTDMKAWVDSAAMALSRPSADSGSAARPPSTDSTAGAKSKAKKKSGTRIP